MPRRFVGYAPDQVDCNTMVSSLAEQFGQVTHLETRYELDQVITIARCKPVAEGSDGVVQVQALVRAALRTAPSLYQMQYSALLDCWHQLDRGTLAVATTPIERGWDGRPRTPRR